jgi:hypothetical protein
MPAIHMPAIGFPGIFLTFSTYLNFIEYHYLQGGPLIANGFCVVTFPMRGIFIQESGCRKSIGQET